MISWFKRYDMTPTTAGLLILLWIFFIGFMLYPLVFVFSNAFFTAEGFSLVYFKLMMTSPNYTTILANSINLGLTVTLLTTLLSLPLAFLLVRYDFPGKVLLNGFILIPLVLPPFVGAIGMRQLLARFGSVNLLLLQMGCHRSAHRLVGWRFCRRHCVGSAPSLPDHVFEFGRRPGERRSEPGGSGEEHGGERL